MIPGLTCLRCREKVMPQPGYDQVRKAHLMLVTFRVEFSPETVPVVVPSRTYRPTVTI